MNRRFLLLFLLLLCVLMPSLLWAHPGHEHSHGLSLWAGLVHPITGIDHMVAALAVGAWAVLGDRSRWQLPAIFLGAMMVGAAVSAAGLAVGGIHLLSSISVVVLGLLLATATLWPRRAVSALVGAVGLIHGGAHLAGVTASGSTIALYVAAIVLGTALLHGAGFLVASRFFENTREGLSNAVAPRWAGAAVALTGLMIVSAHLFM